MRDYRPFIAIAVCLLIVILIPLFMVKGMAAPKEDYEFFTASVNKQLTVLTQVDSGLRSTTDNISALLIGLKANTDLSVADKQVKIDAINQQLSELGNNIANHGNMLTQLNDTLNSKASNAELELFRTTLRNETSSNLELQSLVANMQVIVNSLTTEIRGNSIQGKVKLIGAGDTAPSASSGANTLVLARFQCTTTGTLNLLRIRATTYGGIKVAVYSDNASKPGILLTSSTYDTIVSDGYPTVSVSPISVTAGQFYWLAYDSATACVGWSAGTTGAILYSKTVVAYSTLIFPLTIDTSLFNTDTRICLISGWTGY
jgi:hypothetical protein